MAAPSNSLIEKARNFLFSRAGDYRQVFHPRSVYAHRVLFDLSHFCRAHKNTGNKDPYLAARMDGRREVWLRIQHHLNLTNEDLWRLYDGRTQPQERND